LLNGQAIENFTHAGRRAIVEVLRRSPKSLAGRAFAAFATK
jgi:hypothetical protein